MIEIQLPRLRENTPQLDFKFVVIKDGEDYILRGNAQSKYHYEIVAQTLYDKSKCIGGGRIRFTATKLHAYAFSLDFGVVQNHIVVTLLGDYCRQNNLELVTTMGSMWIE